MDQLDVASQRLRPDPAYFAPDDYLLGIINRAVALRTNVRASLPGMGTVEILPDRDAFYADVADMAEFCRAPASGIKTSSPDKKLIAELAQAHGLGRPIRELLWQAAFHASQGRLVASHSEGQSPVQLYDVVRFTRWPNLRTSLPTSRNTMRICALLTRHPTSLFLVSRILDIEPEEVFLNYSAACSCGIVEIVGATHHWKVELDEGALRAHKNGADHGLFQALRSRITGL